MVDIPKQTFNQRDPGLPVSPEAVETWFYGGTAEKGEVNAIKSFNDTTDVVDEYGQGPLSEDICRTLIRAGGPVLGQRLLGDVAAIIGAVTKLPKGSSTGSLTATKTPVAAIKAWQIDDPAGTPVFVDETTDFASSTASDVDPFPTADAIGDQFAIGYHSPFAALSIVVATSGVGATVTWKYWNGTAWTAVAGISDGTTSFTAAPGTYTVTYTMPTDWERTSLNGEDPAYYLVAEIASGAYATDPVLSSGTIDDQGPFDSYSLRVRVDTTGTLGAGEFSYSLDGQNYSPTPITIPAGGIYDIPNSNVRLTFTAGGGPTFFEAGDRWTAEITAPFVSAASLAAGFTKVKAGSDLFAAYILSGRAATAVTGAALFASLDVELTALETANRPCGAMMDSGVDSATDAKTEFASSASARILVGFETSRQASSKPITGWSNPLRSCIHPVSARAAGSLISTHLGRFADGQLEGVTAIGYDELKGTDAMSKARFCTLRTWDGFPSRYYVNRPNMMKPAGSDFDLWPHRMIMDTAHRTAHASLQQFVNTKIRVNTDGSGTIEPAEAARIEGIVNDALADKILVPFDAEGNRGHAAAIVYLVDLAHNVASNNSVKGKVAIVRDGYAEEIITEIGFAAEAA